MRYLAALLLVVGCEKSGPVDSTPGVVEASERATGPTPTIVAPTVTTTPGQLASEAAHAPEAIDTPRARAERERAEREQQSVAMSEADARAFADKLTALTDDDRFAEGDMARRRPGADLGRDLDLARTVVVGGGTGRGTRGGGAVGMPRVGGPRVDSTSTTRIAVGAPRSTDVTSLKTDVVMRKVSAAYAPGIKRCYLQGVAQDSMLRGTLTLSFKVHETGRVVEPSVTGLTKDVDDCIARQMASWRFEVPRDNDDNPTEASFTIPIQAVPE